MPKVPNGSMEIADCVNLIDSVVLMVCFGSFFSRLVTRHRYKDESGLTVFVTNIPYKLTQVRSE